MRSLILIRLATWCLRRAVTTAPDGAAIILAISHGPDHWSHLWHAGTAPQALEVAGEARHQAWHADRQGAPAKALKGFSTFFAQPVDSGE